MSEPGGKSSYMSPTHASTWVSSVTAMVLACVSGMRWRQMASALSGVRPPLMSSSMSEASESVSSVYCERSLSGLKRRNTAMARNTASSVQATASGVGFALLARLTSRTPATMTPPETMTPHRVERRSVRVVSGERELIEPP